MLPLLKILIFLLFFISGILLYRELYPLLMKRLERWQKKRIDKIAPQLERVWLNIPIEKLVIINITLPFLLGGIGWFFLKSPVGLIGGFVFGLVMPFVVLRFLETRRRNKFASQLVDGIMLLSSSLRAGLSLLQSFEVLVEEMPPPISQEFGLVLRENKIGVPFEDSLISLNKRMNIEELELLVDSILVARETGGDLTKVFSRLTTTIRDRHKLKEKVKTLTIQGRLQGMIMSVLPFLFAWWVNKIDPHHFDVMLKTETGRFLLILAVVFQAVGIFLIRKFSTIKV